MPLKIEAVSREDLDLEFGTDSKGNDPETVKFIAELNIGEGFKVTPEGDETERMVKRRINACAKEAYRELEWHGKENVKTITARVKAIDTKGQTEAAEKAKLEAEEKAKLEASQPKPEVAPPNGAPLAPTQDASKEPVGAGSANKAQK